MLEGCRKEHLIKNVSLIWKLEFRNRIRMKGDDRYVYISLNVEKADKEKHFVFIIAIAILQ